MSRINIILLLAFMKFKSTGQNRFLKAQ